ncbi:hypothetical protein [Nocardioides currus]|uniref:Uncharacterized protein n=1 Tax=Nocardioides currus TaxID=2133958 RepID=A0A2R7YSL1_9ACTN|nr:hypothetical protein [Nocardioides currus]PUA79036.1 hypothetical protein C7S10_21415 [Nocardioides currus]
MTGRPDSLLWWRAGTVSAMTFLLGAVGHVSAGGLMPSWVVLAAMFAIGTTVCASVLSQRVSAGRIIALVALGQTACHAVLSLAAGHAGDAPAVARDLGHGAGTSSLPVSDGHRVGSLQDYYDATVGASTTGSALTVPDPAALLQHLPMFALHTLVAVLVGLWLAAGERALSALLTLVVTRVVALLVVPAVAVTTAPRLAPLRRRPATPPSLARVARTVVRRGPPALLAA